MAMQAETLDVLEKSNVPPAQARAIARAIEIEIAASHRDLATSAQLQVFEGKMDAKSNELRTHLRAEMQAIKAELLAAMRAGFARIDVCFAGQDAKIEASRVSMLRWVFAFFATQITAMISYIFVTHIVK